MNAAYPAATINAFYLCMPPPCSLRTVFPLNIRMRVRERQFISLSFSECTKQSRFPVAFDAGSVVVETSQEQQQSSDVEIPSESVVRRLILLRHAESSWENRSLLGMYNLISSYAMFSLIFVSLCCTEEHILFLFFICRCS
jgi:hypothetical protein